MSAKRNQTIVDIARLAGVSKSTVSRALNDSPLIGEATKDRIRSIAHENQFQINIPARRLSMQQSRTIAFVIHANSCGECFSIADLFSFEIMGAVSLALSRLNYDLLLAHVNPHESSWPHQYLDTGRVDGFILLTSTRKQTHIKALLEMQAPFITWGTPQPNSHYCSVTGDNCEGGRQAGAHLAQTGRRRIAFIGGPSAELEVQCRYDGFVTALKEANLEVDPSLITFGEYTEESTTKRMNALLKEHPDIDAVFTNSDLMAITIVKAVQVLGKKVPQDIAVIGYDNLSIAEIFSPSLTTVSQNIPMIGRLLAQNLIAYLQTGVVTNVTVPSELIVRQST